MRGKMAVEIGVHDLAFIVWLTIPCEGTNLQRSCRGDSHEEQSTPYLCRISRRRLCHCGFRAQRFASERSNRRLFALEERGPCLCIVREWKRRFPRDWSLPELAWHRHVHLWAVADNRKHLGDRDVSFWLLLGLHRRWVDVASIFFGSSIALVPPAWPGSWRLILA